MSDAKQFLDERLAKGELSEAEYDRLAAKLSYPSSRVENHQPASPPLVQTTPPQPADPFNGVKKFVGGAAALYGIAVVVLAFINSPADARVNVYNGCAKVGNSSRAYCECIAQQATAGVTIFNMPLRIVGIGWPEAGSMAQLCRGR